MASEQDDFVGQVERRELHKVLFFNNKRIEKCICGYRPASYTGDGSDNEILKSLMLSHFGSFDLTEEDF